MPYDSFLLDPGLLIGFGIIIVWIAARGFKWKYKWLVPALSVVTMIIFWACSVSLYFDQPWIEWMWRMCGAESGRDWMINSGVFNFDYKNVSEAGHLFCGFMFALYPLWLYVGLHLGRFIFGRHERQDGALGALGVKS